MAYMYVHRMYVYYQKLITRHPQIALIRVNTGIFLPYCFAWVYFRNFYALVIF